MYNDIGFEQYMDYLVNNKYRREHWKDFAKHQMAEDRKWIESFKEMWRKEVRLRKYGH